MLEQNTSPPETSADVRIGRELLKATAPYAVESVGKSWWLTASTFVLLIGAMCGAAFTPFWPLRLLFSLLAALLMVRAFITYHDYMHGAILSRSRLAWLLFHVYSALALTPPRSWKQSHNFHHGHVGQISEAGVGAFPIMTTHMWQEASRAARMRYRVVRHPLTVLTGYLTIFFLNIGYHHIHHLNVRIPFYRLPETMRELPELQSPVTTSLAPRDIRDCFACCLWDEDRQRMVSFREAGLA